MVGGGEESNMGERGGGERERRGVRERRGQWEGWERRE
jgi:hypothetical protein